MSDINVHIIDLENCLDIQQSASVLKMKAYMVCPPILRKGLFTVGAMDNIDHYPLSTSFFHGTRINVFQLPVLKQDYAEQAHVEHKMHSLPELFQQ